MRIRFLYTEAFRLSAIYAGVFALSVLALGSVVFVMTDRAFRDQVVQFSRADIAAMRNGFDAEGIKEAREVLQQIMGKPGESDFLLLQKDGKRIAGNLPPMPARTGIVPLPGAGPGHDILGVGDFLEPGLYVYAGGDLQSRPCRRAGDPADPGLAVRPGHVAGGRLAAPWSAAASCSGATPWRAPAAPSWMAT